MRKTYEFQNSVKEHQKKDADVSQKTSVCFY